MRQVIYHFLEMAIEPFGFTESIGRQLTRQEQMKTNVEETNIVELFCIFIYWRKAFCRWRRFVNLWLVVDCYGICKGYVAVTTNNYFHSSEINIVQ